MGFYDELRCKRPLPDDRVKPDSIFQTKSLGCGLSHYTINEQGHLIFHRRQYEDLPDKEVRPGLWLPQYKLVHEENIDMEYHGDILFGACTPADHYVEYVARFTHGAVEWIRPHEELSEIHKSWFYAKD